MSLATWHIPVYPKARIVYGKSSRGQLIHIVKRLTVINRFPVSYEDNRYERTGEPPHFSHVATEWLCGNGTNRAVFFPERNSAGFDGCKRCLRALIQKTDLPIPQDFPQNGATP